MQLKIFSVETPVSEGEFEEFMELLEEAFPPEERRSRADFLKLCQGEDKYKIYALFKDEKMAAVFTVWEFCDFTFGDHFAVSKSLRGGGIGTSFLKQVLDRSTLPFILEVELPQSEQAIRRLNFYQRNGFYKNDQPYMLPSMQAGFDDVPMHILSYPELIDKDKFDGIVKLLYRDVYSVK